MTPDRRGRHASSSYIQFRFRESERPSQRYQIGPLAASWKICWFAKNLRASGFFRRNRRCLAPIVPTFRGVSSRRLSYRIRYPSLLSYYTVGFQAERSLSTGGFVKRYTLTEYSRSFFARGCHERGRERERERERACASGGWGVDFVGRNWRLQRKWYVQLCCFLDFNITR